ncbi:MAG: hypothetical protein M1820_010305 [Bogoriella megaspora]|nr:MAG: hypothetical protein M1820_010305 [Bogoriella megaspora]
MTERPIKRLRRLSSENDDVDSADDWTPQPAKNRSVSDGRTSSGTSGASSTRPRRSNSGASQTTIERASNESQSEATRSIHLKVKAPPSKLREVTSGATINSRDTFDDTEVITGPRKSRSRKPIVEESSEEDEDEDAEGEDDEEEEQDEDAEGDEDDEEEDADGDVDMEDVYQKPLPIPVAPKATASKPKVTIRRPDISSVTKSVEEKEMEDDEDDESLSELGSQEGEQVDELGEDEEGLEDEEDAEGDDIDSDDETPMGSRGGTPDLSKLTRRQRAQFEAMDGGLMALSNEAQKKKHLTEAETAMRRQEMARRRKNLSEKRNEEEKMDTINRLLKKQAPKRRGRVKDANATSAVAAAADEGATPGEESIEPEKASPLYTRWINNGSGSMLGVPSEWLESPAGRVFTGTTVSGRPTPMQPRRMVEEV